MIIFRLTSQCPQDVEKLIASSWKVVQKRKKEKRRRQRSARMSKDKQQDSVNLADLGAGRPLPRNPLSSLRSLSLSLYMFSYFCMILTPEPDRCAALSEEDRAGLVNALKVRSSTIKDKIIPHAVSWFTGEAVQDDDELEIEDEDEEEEEEEEDDDEEEDEDDEDDDDEDEQTKTKKKVNAQYFSRICLLFESLYSGSARC
ncbi:hypothetical protein BHM03_00046102 [Ensete ventricosum]|nr:hypothetical protein BHM03_00046102 [Ensete ventricosum]